MGVMDNGKTRLAVKIKAQRLQTVGGSGKVFNGVQDPRSSIILHLPLLPPP